MAYMQVEMFSQALHMAVGVDVTGIRRKNGSEISDTVAASWSNR